MGRRSRKRAANPIAPPVPRDESRTSAPVAAPPRPAPRTATYKSRREDAPQPAWAPFPLTELAILLSIVLLGVGFFTHDATRGVLLGGGFVLVTLSAGELALREHFSGYRSHSSLLAGICAVLAAVPVWLLPVPQELVLVVGAVAFFGGLALFRRAFMRRSGGVGFRA
ncbi:hypothetical protein DSM104299_04669 [Baekduia alba]|uniref:hypothetical protein n=1 Tax=Baekduia alba TaxID=2997333 RepID=UPI0023400333|nr:hypothetical protein [Baekduia alba]WCB95917.1 hypothetical protein DSM104299_04669 [Baekduia alba]